LNTAVLDGCARNSTYRPAVRPSGAAQIFGANQILNRGCATKRKLAGVNATANQERVVQEIMKHRDPSNLVMITHDLNISDVVLEDTVPMGEFFVVQPKRSDFNILGKIQLDDR
jgi:hypothetical protein